MSTLQCSVSKIGAFLLYFRILLVLPILGNLINESPSTIVIIESNFTSFKFSDISNTKASGSATPVVSIIIISGLYFFIISLIASSNSPVKEQQTHPPNKSATLTFLPFIISVSILTSPNSFIKIANFLSNFAIIFFNNVVFPDPKNQEIIDTGVFCIQLG